MRLDRSKEVAQHVVMLAGVVDVRPRPVVGGEAALGRRDGDWSGGRRVEEERLGRRGGTRRSGDGRAHRIGGTVQQGGILQEDLVVIQPAHVRTAAAAAGRSVFVELDQRVVHGAGQSRVEVKRTLTRRAARGEAHEGREGR